jgi:hypothetical protein
MAKVFQGWSDLLYYVKESLLHQKSSHVRESILDDNGDIIL